MFKASGRRLRCILTILTMAALASAATHGQPAQNPAAQSPAEKLADAIERVKADNVGYGSVDASIYLETIANAHAVQEIPTLEAFFARTADPDTKTEAAIALVKLGDKNDTYWNLLLHQATLSVDSNPPFPFDMSNAQPKPAPANLDQLYSPEFKDWAKAHDIPPEGAWQKVMYDIPYGLAAMAKTGDPRGIPLLRRALATGNLFLKQTAAAGLAQAGDKAAIPLIIDACVKVTQPLATSIAISLAFFDDPEADRAYAQFVPLGMDPRQVRITQGTKPFGPRPETK